LKDRRIRSAWIPSSVRDAANDLHLYEHARSLDQNHPWHDVGSHDLVRGIYLYTQRRIRTAEFDTCKSCKRCAFYLLPALHVVSRQYEGAPVGSRTRRATTGSRRGSAPGPAGRGLKSDAAPARKALTSGPKKAEQSAAEQRCSNPSTSQETSSQLEVDLEVALLPGVIGFRAVSLLRRHRPNRHFGRAVRPLQRPRRTLV
jgi:hypothetical protein